MSISQTLCTSFKEQLFLAVHNFSTDTFNIALYTDNANIDADTTVYDVSLAGQVPNGLGYAAGGITLTGVTVNTSGTTAYVSFANAVWSPATFTCRGALIYNTSKSNKAVAVLDFGADKTALTIFTVTMPANTATSALIRLP
jgi:hypothetical protein